VEQHDGKNPPTSSMTMPTVTTTSGSRAVDHLPHAGGLIVGLRVDERHAEDEERRRGAGVPGADGRLDGVTRYW
jgi:hypothetical protein